MKPLPDSSSMRYWRLALPSAVPASTFPSMVGCFAASCGSHALYATKVAPYSTLIRAPKMPPSHHVFSLTANMAKQSSPPRRVRTLSAVRRPLPWSAYAPREMNTATCKMTLREMAADAKLVGSTGVPAKLTRSGKSELPSASRHWLTVAGSPGHTSPTQPSAVGASCRKATSAVVTPRASAMKVALRITLGHTSGNPDAAMAVSWTKRGQKPLMTTVLTALDPASKAYHPRSSRWVTGGWSGSVSASAAGRAPSTASACEPALAGTSAAGAPPPPAGDGFGLTTPVDIARASALPLGGVARCFKAGICRQSRRAPGLCMNRRANRAHGGRPGRAWRKIRRRSGHQQIVCARRPGGRICLRNARKLPACSGAAARGGDCIERPRHAPRWRRRRRAQLCLGGGCSSELGPGPEDGGAVSALAETATAGGRLGRRVHEAEGEAVLVGGPGAQGHATDDPERVVEAFPADDVEASHGEGEAAGSQRLARDCPARSCADGDGACPSCADGDGACPSCADGIGLRVGSCCGLAR
mmetsp:Transcript_11005/g.42559  ORF Transcript_11005/g.42559 Transcript_11005/m.42559 type:complete len:529 (-) Transcript_11005:663-2249(-)